MEYWRKFKITQLSLYGTFRNQSWPMILMLRFFWPSFQLNVPNFNKSYMNHHGYLLYVSHIFQYSFFCYCVFNENVLFVSFPKINIRTTHALAPLRCMDVWTCIGIYFNSLRIFRCLSVRIAIERKRTSPNTIGKSQKLYCRKLGSRASDIAVRTRGYLHIENFCNICLIFISNPS